MTADLQDLFDVVRAGDRAQTDLVDLVDRDQDAQAVLFQLKDVKALWLAVDLLGFDPQDLRNASGRVDRFLTDRERHGLLLPSQTSCVPGLAHRVEYAQVGYRTLAY